MSIEFQGIDEVIGNIGNLLDEQTMRAALGKACALVERDAKIKAPKGSGELRNHIKSRIEPDGESLRGVVYNNLEYAPYVEYGTGLFAEKGGRQDVPWCYQDEKGEWHSTSGMPPQPYMRPALDENRVEITRIIKGEIFNG